MKKLVLLMLFCFSLTAGWEESWIKAIEFCRAKAYMQAEKHFNEAIKELIAKKDYTHPHVWVDRARLYSLQGRDEEALQDLYYVADSIYLKGEDFNRYIITRMMSHIRLEMFEEAEIDRQIFREIAPIPKLEVYDTHVIMRNIPDMECAQQIIKKYIAHIFCDSENDVTISNGICIAKRSKSDCGCGCKKDPLINKNAASNCKWYCEKGAWAGQNFCSGTFNSGRCLFLCSACVEGLKDACNWCCAVGKFYETCVKPFADIVGAMGNVCDPAWD